MASPFSYTGTPYVEITNRPFTISPTLSDPYTSNTVFKLNTSSVPLPSGVYLDANNGDISGTIFSDTPPITYIIDASYVSSDISANIIISSIPAFYYVGSPYTKESNEPIIISPSFNDTSIVTSFSINSSLPIGLSFNTTNGSIIGTATNSFPSTTYTVTANYSSPAYTTTSQLTLSIQPPPIQYPQSSYSETIYSQFVIQPIQIYTNTSFSISPSLPSGIYIDASNGNIIGNTNLDSSSNKTYTVTALDTIFGTPTTTQISISVASAYYNDLSETSYLISSYSEILIDPSFSIVIPPATSYNITPSLPFGFSIGSSSARISGYTTPNSISGLTQYTVTANTNPPKIALINITVVASKYFFSSLNSFNIIDTSFTSVQIDPSYNVSTSYSNFSISPSLPANLSIDSISGRISGYTDVSGSNTYTVRATNNSGNITNSTLAINTQPAFYYNVNSFYVTNVDQFISPTFNIRLPNTNITYSITPALSGNSSITDTTGNILINESSLSSKTYIVDASYSISTFHDVARSLPFEIIIIVPFYYNPTYSYLTYNSVSISPTFEPIINPLDYSFSISPSLPIGLILNTTNGNITGYTSTIINDITYTVNGQNTTTFQAISASFILNIGSSGIVPFYYDSPYYYTTYSPILIDSSFITLINPLDYSFSISPSLPIELTFNTSNGDITGYTSEIINGIIYTVTGQNITTLLDISASFILNITDSGIDPFYYNSPYYYTTYSPILIDSSFITLINPLDYSFSINNPLPIGLNFDSSNGDISGNTSEIINNITYIVTGQNTSTLIDISASFILDTKPALTYPNSPYNIFNYLNINISPEFISSPYPPLPINTYYYINSTTPLPSGLSVQSNTGKIIGNYNDPNCNGLQNYIVDASYTISNVHFIAPFELTINLQPLFIYPSTPYNEYAYVPVEIDNSLNYTFPTSPTFSLSASLPAGLSINSSNGNIRGTTNIIGSYIYIVDASFTDSGIHYNGKSPLTININNGFYYEPDTYLLATYSSFFITPIIPTQIPPLLPSNTVFSIKNQTLPGGINIDASNGNIFGNLSGSSLSPLTEYTIYAMYPPNVEVITTISIRVVDSFVYIPSSYNYSAYSPVSIIPTINIPTLGASFYSVPQLLENLSINQTTGIISGFAINKSVSSVNYSIQVNYQNPNYTAITPLTINITDAFIYPSTPYTEYTYVPVQIDNSINYVPTGAIFYLDQDIPSALPSGLSIVPSNGNIRGSTAISGLYNYIVDASYSINNTIYIAQNPLTINMIDSFVYPTTPYSQYTGLPVVIDSSKNFVFPPDTVFTISPDLPSGLNIDAINGNIRGISNIPSSIDYIVDASFNNNGVHCIAKASINITIINSFYYNGNPYNNEFTYKPFTQTPISSGIPNNAQYLLDPNTPDNILPPYFNINSSNGTISGTTDISGSYNCIIDASFSINGINYINKTPFNINISDSFVYAGTPYTEYTYSTIEIDSSINYNFPADTLYTINPSLPSGLTIDANNGNIRGSSLNSSNGPKSYIVHAQYSDGSANANLSIDISSAFIYQDSPYKYGVGNNFSIDPLYNNANLTSYSPVFTISPNLPSDIFINSQTGKITGIATVNNVSDDIYTVDASYSILNTHFNAKASLNIIITSNFNYPSSPYIKTTYTPIVIDPSFSVPYTSDTLFTITPRLPVGLNIDASNGNIRGNTSIVTPSTKYTVDASYATYIASTDLYIQTLSVFYYPFSPYKEPTNQFIQIDPSFNTTGFTNPIYTISKQLPNKISLNTSTGVISGTTDFSSLSSLTTYTVTVNHEPNGVARADFQLSIGFTPQFRYANSPYSLLINSYTNIVPTYLISNLPNITYMLIPNYGTSTTLPTGLQLNSANGIIYGAPTIDTPMTTYYIRATNSGIIYDASLNISVIAPPVFSYPQTSYNLTQLVPVSIAPVNAQSNVTYTNDILCALPLGLTLNPTTGVISGTPTLLTPHRSYKITATNNLLSSAKYTLTLIINISREVLAPVVTSSQFDDGLCLTNPVIQMRRKAEILKYKNNSSNITKAQNWSQIVNGVGKYSNQSWATQGTAYTNPNVFNLEQQGNTLICQSNPVICNPSSSSDVPGPVIEICDDPSVPLVGYVQPIRTKTNIGFKWPQRSWRMGDMGFPRGKAGSQGNN